MNDATSGTEGLDVVPLATSKPSVPREHGIDGLRAVAAIWVVLYHMWAFSGGSLWPGVDFLVRSGSTGVSLFLVLSGLCLYLPYAGGRQSRFSNHVFFRRRLRRLLPAYYASLVIVIAMHLLGNGRLGLPRYSASEMALQTATHVTFTHQLFPETFYGLNGAYWSLGLEWELYLTLPLLIWAAVRFGLARTVAVVFGVTAVYRLGIFAATATGLLDQQGAWAGVVLPNFFLGRWSEFALGMVAAEMFRTGRLRAGWPLLMAGAVAVALAVIFPDNPLKHMLFGVVFFTLVAVVLSGGNVVARAFSWRPLVAIGVISYSLYLVHQPIVEVMGAALGANQGADPKRVFLAMLLLSPVILAAALALFGAVERRSLSAGSAHVPVRDLMFPRSRTKPKAPREDVAASGPVRASQGADDGPS